MEQPSADPRDVLLCVATSLGDIGTFRWDLAADEMRMSDRARVILGMRAEAAPTTCVIETAVHPDDRARAFELRERSLAAAAEVPAAEWQILGDGDSIRWVAMKMVPARGGVEMVGALLDVTERHERERRLGAAADSPLTARETEVLQMASHGGSSATIAERLVISTSTVKTHFEHIYAKLGVADRAGAVAEALRRGLIK